MEDQSRVKPSPLASGSYSVMGSVQIQPSAKVTSLHSEQLEKHQKRLPEDTEMAVEALDDLCVEPTAQDTSGAPGQESTKAFPLIFIKHFQSSWSQDRAGPETVPEADFEEVASAEKQTNHNGSSDTPADIKNSSEGSEKSGERSATKGLVCNSSSPKKRLMLSLSEKEKLLNWDMLATPEESPSNANNKNTQELQFQAETEADKLQTDSSQDGQASLSQTSASSTSTFQLIANAFRRTFSVTNPSSSSNTAVPIRPKREGNRKQRPMSLGAVGLTSLFSNVGPEPSRDENMTDKTVGGNPWESGKDLPSLLQSVSLRGRRSSGGAFSDDMASLPRKRVNLFSSLRLKKSKASEKDGQDQEVQKEIMTILTNLSNKASSQQNLEDPSSSDDELQDITSNEKLCTERLRRKQEKMVAQQAKREQLKRLHRAQTIQRQLEEVAEKQRDLEERGVAIEKTIRGETESDDSDETQLYQTWFKLVLEKNRLARYESEVMIFAQELELEDTQSRLQQELRHRMAVEDTKKSASELQEEQEMLSEIMRTVEKRDMLVSILEEQRLKERAEDRDLESLILFKGYEFNWVQSDDTWGQENVN